MNELLEYLIGKTKEEAIELCKNNGFTSRVVREDSHNYMVTMDFKMNRINLSLDNDIITSCDIG